MINKRLPASMVHYRPISGRRRQCLMSSNGLRFSAAVDYFQSLRFSVNPQATANNATGKEHYIGGGKRPEGFD
jgi:hypothetical protein